MRSARRAGILAITPSRADETNQTSVPVLSGWPAPLALRFAQQQGDPAQISRLLRMQLESPFISIEVDGDLLLIPRESIKYLQVCPAPPSMPETTIHGAELID